MKLVKEHINEKFVADSDPIHDMGIGIYYKHDFLNVRDLTKYVYEICPVLFKENNRKKLLSNSGSAYLLDHNIAATIVDYCRKYLTINGIRSSGPDFSLLFTMIKYD